MQVECEAFVLTNCASTTRTFSPTQQSTALESTQGSRELEHCYKVHLKIIAQCPIEVFGSTLVHTHDLRKQVTIDPTKSVQHKLIISIINKRRNIDYQAIENIMVAIVTVCHLSAR